MFNGVLIAEYPTSYKRSMPKTSNLVNFIVFLTHRASFLRHSMAGEQAVNFVVALCGRLDYLRWQRGWWGFLVPP